MKILIIGDFSSSGHFLAHGFNKLGIETKHVAYQNGWRENPIEVNLTSKHKGLIGRLDNYITPFTTKDLTGHDAVIFVDNYAFPRTFGINSRITRLIQQNNNKSYYWVMGCDSNFRKWGRVNNFELCNPCLMYDQKSLKCICEKDEMSDSVFLSGIDTIIPSTYEYYQAHKDNPKTSLMIQIPVLNNEPIVPFDNGIIKMFHGLNRYGFKGTHIVEKVFNEMSDKYPSDVSFLIKGKMPFREYTKLLSQQHVIVDQIFNQCMGMNSLLTLAQGRILVAGSPGASCDIYGIPLPPMFITEPSVVSLRRTLENVIANKNSFNDYQEQSIQYVKDYHAPEVVAKKFLKVLGWEN